MNNSEKFGEIIYSKSMLQMINVGKILRPRIHLVDVSKTVGAVELDNDVNAIIQSFIEHKIHCQEGAKLLVVTKGSEHLNDITMHPEMIKFRNKRRFLKIFDISSAKGARINGEIVNREKFLSDLRNMSDNDDAIIFHINILSEGIDVPGITGIMPMHSLSVGKFLQTYGRASRLHVIDREDLKNGIKKVEDIDEFIKPYGWIIIPIYGTCGEDLKSELTEVVYALRNSGFRAAEDVVIKDSKGSAIPVPLSGINEMDKNAIRYKELFVSVTHEIEEKEKADKLAIEDFRLKESIKRETLHEMLKLF